MGCWSVVVRPIDSCDVHTRLENLLPLHESRAARPEARRVTEWRVDLRTPTRLRFLASFAPPRRLHHTAGALLRDTRLHLVRCTRSLVALPATLASTHIVYNAYSLLRKDCHLSFRSLSSFSRGISCFAHFFSPLPRTLETELASK